MAPQGQGAGKTAPVPINLVPFIYTYHAWAYGPLTGPVHANPRKCLSHYHNACGACN